MQAIMCKFNRQYYIYIYKKSRQAYSHTLICLRIVDSVGGCSTFGEGFAESLRIVDEPCFQGFSCFARLVVDITEMHEEGGIKPLRGSIIWETQARSTLNRYFSREPPSPSGCTKGFTLNKWRVLTHITIPEFYQPEHIRMLSM